MISRIYRNNADLRKTQINTLKIFNANVTEITDDKEYQIEFKSGENDCILLISLGHDFPQEKPLIKISPVVYHPWVNSEGDVISAPGLLNFTIHSDLGRVVQAIIREFERNPPPLYGNYSGNSAVMTKNSTSTSPIQYSPAAYSPPSLLKPNINNYGLFFNELKALTNDELLILNENIEKQDELLLQLPHIKESHDNVDDLLSQIQELADKNLSKMDELEKLKSEIVDRVNLVSKHVEENEKLHEDYENLCEKFSPKNIQEHLRQSLNEADEDSEKLADSFLKGDLELDKFLSSYLKRRTIYQIRKTKEEKLSQQIHNLEKAGF